MTRPVKTNPRIIRDALAIVDAQNTYQAVKATGIAYRTIQRWVRRRAELGRPWPTEQDIAAWEADDAANRARRERNAAQAREYRKRVYLNRGPLQVPALGTMRRIRALSALGWTFEEIGAEMGVTNTRVGHLAAGYWGTVFPQTAADVDRVYRRLCMTVPTDPEPTRRGEVRVHARCRKWARNKGWAPPLAYDDIDDPNETPAGFYEAATREEILRDLNGLGAGVTRACRELGMTRDALQKWCGNHGLNAVYRSLTARENPHGIVNQHTTEAA